MTRLGRLAQRVGLVSMVHTREMDVEKGDLLGAGVALYLWRNAALDRPPAPAAPGPSRWRRAAAAAYGALVHRRGHPRDTRLQDVQFRNLSGPPARGAARRVLAGGGRRAIQLRPLARRPAPPSGERAGPARRAGAGLRAPGLDGLPSVGSLSPAPRGAPLPALRTRVLPALRPRRHGVAGRRGVGAAALPAHQGATVAIPVDPAYFGPMRGVIEARARVVFTGVMDHPPNVDRARGRGQMAFLVREPVLPAIEIAGLVPDNGDVRPRHLGRYEGVAGGTSPIARAEDLEVGVPTPAREAVGHGLGADFPSGAVPGRQRDSSLAWRRAVLERARGSVPRRGRVPGDAALDHPGSGVPSQNGEVLPSRSRYVRRSSARRGYQAER